MDEQFVGVLPCIADAFGFAIGDGDGVDGVGILMIEDKEIIFATAGGDVEMTSLIRIGLQKRLIVEKHDSNLMGARLELRGKKAIGGGRGERRERNNRTSGTNVFGLLILMTKCSSKGLWEMFADELGSGGEAREGGEMATTDRR